MKIDNVSLRTVKAQGMTEVFMTSEDPVINTVLRLPPDMELESGDYSVTFTKKATPVVKSETAKSPA